VLVSPRLSSKGILFTPLPSVINRRLVHGAIGTCCRRAAAREREGGAESAGIRCQPSAQSTSSQCVARPPTPVHATAGHQQRTNCTPPPLSSQKNERAGTWRWRRRRRRRGPPTSPLGHQQTHEQGWYTNY
jgi:hypothetical protein